MAKVNTVLGPFEFSDATKLLLSNWSYAHIFNNIIPALKDAGISEDKINTLRVKNPRRLFSG